MDNTFARSGDSTIVVPKKGDELYKGLLAIFEDEDRLDDGLEEAKELLIHCIEGILDYPAYLKSHYDRNTAYIDSLTVMWFLVKLQPQTKVTEKVLRELEVGIEKGVRPLDNSFFDDECREEYIRFLQCKNLILEQSSLKYFAPPDTKEVSNVKRVKRTMGVSVLTTPLGASEVLEGAIRKMQEILKKVKNLEYAVKEKDVMLKERGNLIVESGKKCESLENEKKELKKKMDSREFRNEVGQEYLKKVFEDYLRDADDMDQSLRKDWFNVLQGLCSIEGVPKEVKKMIQLLKRKPKSNDIVTVKAESGATVNNYDIHGNNQVNTNKAD